MSFGAVRYFKFGVLPVRFLLRVSGLGFRVWGLGFRGLGFRVEP